VADGLAVVMAVGQSGELRYRRYGGAQELNGGKSRDEKRGELRRKGEEKNMHEEGEMHNKREIQKWSEN